MSESYLDSALKSAGLPVQGSRQEKIDRLVKHGTKNNNAPKNAISKGSGKKKVKLPDVPGSNCKDKVTFFSQNAPKVSGTVTEKRKKLEAMWLALETQSKQSTMYSLFDEELETNFAASMGLKKVGEKDGQHVYKAIGTSNSSSKSPISSPVSTNASSPKAKASPKEADAPKTDDENSSFGLFKNWLSSLSKPTLVAIAQDKKISVSGNKPDLVKKLMTSTEINENEASDDSSSSDSDEDDDEEDENDEDEDENDEDEDEDEE